MRYLLVTGCLAVTSLLAGAVPVEGQQRDCELPQGATVLDRVDLPQGQMITIDGPVTVRCTGGVTIRGAKMIYFDWNRELQVIGNGSYTESDRSIAATNLTYMGTAGQLSGSGNVVLTDLRSGSRIRGETLFHMFGAQGQPSRSVVQGGTPHATLRRAGAAPGDTAAAPVEIDANAFEIYDERDFRAHGNVRFTRGTLSGRAGSLRYDQDRNRLYLLQGGHLENPDFQLDGDSIDALLPQEELREVNATGRATLSGDELQVHGRTLRLAFENGALQRLVALAAEPGAASPEARAIATAENFRLVADSIDALAPRQVLQEVVAVGSAYGEQSDTIASSLPPIAARDWLRGDTIRGYFADAPEPAPGDTAGRQRVLERLVAVGGEQEAQGMHRIRDEARTGDPAINFLVAKRITVEFISGSVGEVIAEGQLKGIHLQPRPAPPQPQGTTSGAGTR